MSDNAALGGTVLSFFFGAIAFIVAVFIARAVFSIGKIVKLLETISRKLGPDVAPEDDLGRIVINKPLK